MIRDSDRPLTAEELRRRQEIADRGRMLEARGPVCTCSTDGINMCPTCNGQGVICHSDPDDDEECLDPSCGAPCDSCWLRLERYRSALERIKAEATDNRVAAIADDALTPRHIENASESNSEEKKT